VGVAQALERHCVRPGIRDGAVAGYPAREARAVLQRHRFEALLDSLVLVAQAFFQSQDLLADDREAEVSRLDRAGVHRTDRDFVHAFAFDADELVVVSRRRCAGAGEIPAQGEFFARPCAMAQPSTRVGRLCARACGANAHEIESGSLHASRTGKQVRNVRVGRLVRGHRKLETDKSLVESKQRSHPKTLPAVAFVARPKGGKTSACLTRGFASCAPGARVDLSAPCGHRSGNRSELDIRKGWRHGVTR
jgi:hypothetical protein